MYCQNCLCILKIWMWIEIISIFTISSILKMLFFYNMVNLFVFELLVYVYIKFIVIFLRNFFNSFVLRLFFFLTSLINVINSDLSIIFNHALQKLKFRIKLILLFSLNIIKIVVFKKLTYAKFFVIFKF